ncbi:MAG: hypothetical protein GY858_05425 [Candidatus Omnitrophica bacterium]|nr:hypothetical protein [Candidatus Omnitrophota bacterium]
MNGSFYFFLPSSVPSGAIANTQSHFITSLQAPVHLDSEHECGLNTFIYPANLNNIYDGRLSFWSYTFGIDMISDLASGFYKTIDDLIQEINKALGPDKEFYKFSHDKFTHKVMVELISGDNKTIPYLEMNENVSVLTGFPLRSEKIGFVVGDRAYDLSGGISAIYIYSDIIAHSYIGNSSSPILAIVPYNFEKYGTVQSYSPKKIMYFPVKDISIQEITIELRTKTGQFLPFPGGGSETILILNMRKKPPVF